MSSLLPAEYEKYRAAQMADGHLFQDFVVDLAWQAGLVIAQYASKTYQLAIGESRSGVEIKHDKKLNRTHNVYIEYAEKARPRPGPYAASGIMRDGHWLYAIGDYDVVYFFANSLLRKLRWCEGTYEHIETATSQGFLLPEAKAESYAALILRPGASGKVEKVVNDLAALADDLHRQLTQPPGQLTLWASDVRTDDVPF